MGHSCRTLLWDTLVGHSYRTLLRGTLVGHSCRTLLWDTLVGHSCVTLLWATLVGHSCGTLLWDTLMGHSCGTLLWDTLVGHSCRKLLWDTLIPCACHEPFPIRTSNAHKVLRLPRNVTSLTPCNLTIPCACHENRTSTLQSPHEVLRLPRKVTISSHVSFNKICTTPHVWNDSDPFRAHSNPPKSPLQLRLVTKTELRCHTLKRKSQWHGHIQHPKNTTLQTLIPMELRSNLRISQNAAPVQRNASRFLRDMSVSCKSQWNSGAN